MPRRKNRQHRAPWRHQRRSSTTRQGPQSEDIPSDGSKAADVTLNNESTCESQEESFLADSESHMGSSLDSSSMESLKLDCPGADANTRGNVDVGSVLSMERDLSCLNMEEALSSSRVESNENMANEAESPQDLSPPSDPLQDGTESKAHLEKHGAEKTESDEIIQHGEQVDLKLALSEPMTVLSPPKADDQYTPQKTTEIPDAEDPERELPTLRMNQNEDQREITDADMLSEDGDQRFQSENSKCEDETKEDSSKSDANLFHGDLAGNKDVLEQTEITTTNDQPSQKNSGVTEDPTSAQTRTVSQETSEKPSSYWIALQSSDQHLLEKGPQEQSREHQCPKEKIRDQTLEEEEIPEPSTANEDLAGLEQTEITAIEDQPSQKTSGVTENPTSAQSASQETAEKPSGYWSALQSSDQHLEKGPEEQSHELAKHQCPKEMMRDETLEENEIPVPSIPHDQGFQEEKDSCKDLSENAVVMDESINEFPATSHLSRHEQLPEGLGKNQASSDQDKILDPDQSNENQSLQNINSGQEAEKTDIQNELKISETSRHDDVPEKSKCDNEVLVPGDNRDSHESTEGPLSGESTSNRVCLHQDEIMDSNAPNEGQPQGVESQAAAEDNSVRQIPEKPAENRAVSVQNACYDPKTKPVEDIQPSIVKSNQNEQQTGYTNPNDSSKIESLNSKKATGARSKTSSRPVTPAQAKKIQSAYHKWDKTTSWILRLLDSLQSHVTNAERLFNTWKRYCVKRSLWGKLVREDEDVWWISRVIGAVKSLTYDYSLTGISLLHTLVTIVARVKLFEIMKIDYWIKQQLYAASPSTMAEGNCVKDCFKEISKATICGVASNIFDNINTSKQQKAMINSNGWVDTLVFKICDIAEGISSGETSKGMVKSLGDFLIDNRPVVEAYAAGSKSVHGTYSFYKTWLWDVITGRNPDPATRLKDFVHVLHDYEYQFDLSKQAEDSQLGSSVIRQIEEVRSAIKADADEIARKITELGIIEV